MAEPARRREAPDDVPALDPYAVRRAYQHHRARRYARLEQRRARQIARLRFLIVLTVLLALFVFLGLSTWREIERLFGL